MLIHKSFIIVLFFEVKRGYNCTLLEFKEKMTSDSSILKKYYLITPISYWSGKYLSATKKVNIFIFEAKMSLFV